MLHALFPVRPHPPIIQASGTMVEELVSSEGLGSLSVGCSLPAPSLKIINFYSLLSAEFHPAMEFSQKPGHRQYTTFVLDVWPGQKVRSTARFFALNNTLCLFVRHYSLD